jgi:hypothetical protein
MIGRRGASEPAAADTPPDETRAMRVLQARTRTRWTEIPEPVRRGRFYVDAASDELLVLHRGDLFDRAGHIRFDELRDLRFYLDRAGELVVLEPATVAQTWSEYVERQARRKVRA